MLAFPIRFPGRRVAVVAHRGAGRRARENTLEAFRLAGELGADAVELDVRRTADGAMVVHHDATVPGLGVPSDHELAAVRAAAPWVPLLEEALDACDGLWVNIEVKNLPVDPDWDPDEHLAASVARLVGERGWRERVLVSSFNARALTAAREVDRGIATGLLVPRDFDVGMAIDLAAEAGHRSIHPADDALGEEPAELVGRAHELGLAVLPWTVDEPERMRALSAAGVEGIITNVPDVAHAILTNRP